MTLSSKPPSLRWLFSRGATFPVVQYQNREICDSFEIYKFINNELTSLDTENLNESLVREFQKDLEKLFFKYSLGRCGHGKNILFFKAWSNMQSSQNSVASDFYRAFLSCYFFCLIKIGRLSIRIRGHKPYNLEVIKKELSKWNSRLESSDYFSGPDIGIFDYAFFGHVECMASGPTDELLNLFTEYPNLMKWLRKMLETTPSYGPMYSRRILDFENIKYMRSGFYWPFLVFLIAFFPIVLFSIIFLFFVRFRSKNYSGAKLYEK